MPPGGRDQLRDNTDVHGPPSVSFRVEYRDNRMFPGGPPHMPPGYGLTSYA
jgi:hypothetical protein